MLDVTDLLKEIGRLGDVQNLEKNDERTKSVPGAFDGDVFRCIICGRFYTLSRSLNWRVIKHKQVRPLLATFGQV